MPNTLKNDVQRFCKDFRDEVERFPAETMTFSFMLGLEPEECTGMYLESGMDADFICDYNRICNWISECKEA